MYILCLKIILVTFSSYNSKNFPSPLFFRYLSMNRHSFWTCSWRLNQQDKKSYLTTNKGPTNFCMSVNYHLPYLHASYWKFKRFLKQVFNFKFLKLTSSKAYIKLTLNHQQTISRHREIFFFFLFGQKKRLHYSQLK